jgi:hypothetical protein
VRKKRHERPYRKDIPDTTSPNISHGVTIIQMRQKGKDANIAQGRKLFSIVAHEYGYKGREIAEYMRKDPALITRHIKDEGMKREAAKVITLLKNRRKDVNSQV